MSFLAPWFLAAGLAVAAPILFHLIRRTPKGRQAFGSLMFLTPSPPTFTRRSRLDQWLLLALRSLAIILLALAFARPFIREASQLDLSDVAGRRMTIALDGSASMRRGNLWRQAKAKVIQLAREASPGDSISLLLFDRQAKTLVRFEDWRQAAPEQRASLVQAALEKTQPSWAATDLGAALVTAAETLQAAEDNEENSATLGRQIIVISDMQIGAALEALQTYQWPQDVLVEALPVKLEQESNAGLHLAAEATESEFDDGKPKEKATRHVRVDNDARSRRDSFRIAWRPQSLDPKAAKSDAKAVDAPTPAYVPAGQTRVYELPLHDTQGGVWTLTGDDHAFDNSLYLAPEQTSEVTVAYLGSDGAGDAQGLLYYLSRAYVDTPRRKVQVASHPVAKPLVVTSEARPNLIVLAEPPSAQALGSLEQFLEAGGTILATVQEVKLEPALAQLAAVPTLRIEAGQPADYALFGEIDFAHPLFSPFAQPRHSDFTKIRFRRTFRIVLPGSASDDTSEKASKAATLARFDNGDPALLEIARGRGKLLVLASSWRPGDSQLALSTKFAPLLARLLDLSGSAEAPPPQYLVNDPVLIPPEFSAAGPVTAITPEGHEIRLASNVSAFTATATPGLYRLTSTEKNQWFAVNVPPSESRVAPLEAEELARWGVRLGRVQTQAEELAKQRQRRDVELERRQQLWRWLLASALSVLMLETVVAARKARSADR